MARRFPIADLRTLVARALQAGGYTPADSGRVRAVPDTRTIRYYTTLGLIDRPSEMRGRTALYEEKHVMQLVAIKRLQGQNQTLSGIQERLVGITPRRLKQLADLPADFWDSADRYLNRTGSPGPGPVAAKPAGPRSLQPDEESAFWAEAPALPGSRPESVTGSPQRPESTARGGAPLRLCMQLRLHRDLQLIIEASPGTTDESLPIDISRLQAAAGPLLDELVRQGLLPSTGQAPVTRAPHGDDTSAGPKESS